MQITLHTEEFNEAVRCYLQRQGFRDIDWIIDTRVVQGRNGNEPRAEITLTKREVGENIEIPFESEEILLNDNKKPKISKRIDTKENLDFLKRQD